MVCKSRPICNSLPIENPLDALELAFALPVHSLVASLSNGIPSLSRLMRRILDPTVPVSRRPGIIMGVGLGGLADGILLHQIMHWHNMGSAVLPPTTMPALEQNMVWDGLFHAAAWLFTLAGIYMLRSDTERGRAVPTARMLSGQIIAGWGLFNVVEGIIDHHILNLHHVKDLPIHVPILDWLFLLIAGLGFTAIGLALAQRDPPHAPAPAL